ncbi:YdcF family protein [Butyrivibrio sp. NC3005]|uniref:YdcF family protein n=1 Tax=Butyrivibrio sp. NC3005 TaxID=1280685 RepID=UPI0003FBDADB|nr:YdcF family protein [Butyrivibrio sp. NC3005]
MKKKVLSGVLLFFTFLFFVYSIVIFAVGSGTFSFAMWLFLSAVFGTLFLLVKKDKWNSIPKWIRKVALSLLTIFALVIMVCQGLIISDFFDKADKNLDYIIVLGAQMKSYGPSYVYRERLDEAYQYLIENENTICVLTGGKGFNEPVAEGEGGRDYLLKKGIPAGRIIVENKSVNTRENVRGALKQMGLSKAPEEELRKIRIGIITNNFHVFRGVYIAKKVTKANICGIAAPAHPAYLPNNLLRESFGILKDFIFI